MEARGRCWVSFYITSIRLAGQQAPRISMSPVLELQTHTHLTECSDVGAGIRTQVLLTPAEQALYKLSHLPSP